MNQDDIRKLYQRESAASADEAARTAQDVGTDPEAARKLFTVVLAMAPTDRAFEGLLRALIDSVVIDWITNTMTKDDEFALVIGQRMLKLMDAMKPAWRAGRHRMNKIA
jgi:hypothetical protein